MTATGPDELPFPEVGSWSSGSAADTEQVGADLARALEVGDVVALVGPLGAGKTRLVAGAARALGWRAAVRSPTFTLLHEYQGGSLTLFHADLYRLVTSDVDGLGLDEALERGALAVEWGEKLPARWLFDSLILTIEIVSDECRRLGARCGGDGRGSELLARSGLLRRAREDEP